MTTIPFYQPERGDYIWMDFSPHAGTEQGERRPGLVLSRKRFNVATGLALVVPITSKGKGSPFEVEATAGTKVKGYVLASHARTLDWIVRRAVFIERAPAHIHAEVAAIVAAILQD